MTAQGSTPSGTGHAPDDPDSVRLDEDDLRAVNGGVGFPPGFDLLAGRRPPQPGPAVSG
jgi:hypothetical protein